MPIRTNPIPFLRIVAMLEGISYIALLGIAMPLKYIWKMPQAVLYVGSVHGGLFVVFCLALLIAMRAANWSLARAFVVFLSSIIPFGTFIIDRRLRQLSEEFGARPIAGS